MDNNLSLALSDSISEGAGSVATELLEVGLDSILDDGLFKEIPILSTTVSLYKIGHGVRELHYVKKLAAFIYALNNGIVDEGKREYYRSRIKGDVAKRNKELEYLLLMIDRYIHSDKSEMLAKLYLAYLDGKLEWAELTRYAETIDRFLPGDYYVLSCEITGRYLANHRDFDAFQRLSALGLMCEDKSTISYMEEQRKMASWTLKTDEHWYIRTSFGTKLYQILELSEDE